MKQHIIILVLATFDFFACTRDVTIAIPKDKAMPVLNSIIAKDSVVYANLSYSKPSTERSTYTDIDNADVSLFANNVFVEKLMGQNIKSAYYYVSKHKAATGETLRIEAKINGQSSTVKGETTIPAAPDVTAGNTYQIKTSASGTAEYFFDFTVNDPASIENYYQLRLLSVVKYVNNNGTYSTEMPIPYTIENMKNNRNEGFFGIRNDEEEEPINYFSDELFNGKSFVIKLKSKNFGRTPGTVKIELSAISKETYLYEKTVRLQFDRDDDLLYEKVKIYSNITNGLGIVGSLHSKRVVQNQM